MSSRLKPIRARSGIGKPARINRTFTLNDENNDPLTDSTILPVGIDKPHDLFPALANHDDDFGSQAQNHGLVPPNQYIPSSNSHLQPYTPSFSHSTPRIHSPSQPPPAPTPAINSGSYTATAPSSVHLLPSARCIGSRAHNAQSSSSTLVSDFREMSKMNSTGNDMSPIIATPMVSSNNPSNERAPVPPSSRNHRVHQSLVDVLGKDTSPVQQQRSQQQRVSDHEDDDENNDMGVLSPPRHHRVGPAQRGALLESESYFTNQPSTQQQYQQQHEYSTTPVLASSKAPISQIENNAAQNPRPTPVLSRGQQQQHNQQQQQYHNQYQQQQQQQQQHQQQPQQQPQQQQPQQQQSNPPPSKPTQSPPSLTNHHPTSSKQTLQSQQPTQSQPHPYPRISICNHIYTILKPLGKGGSGKVYQAIRDDTAMLCAIKEIDLSLDMNTEQAIQDEVTLLQQLNQSPHVVKLLEHEHVPHKQCYYIVLELGSVDFGHIMQKSLQAYKAQAIAAIQLRQKEEEMAIPTPTVSSPSSQSSTRTNIEPCGGLSFTQICFYWEQILLCVQTCHQHNILHLDLKPANFVLVNNIIKLIDFGIAKTKSAEVTSLIQPNVIGTLAYISPEQLASHAQSSNDAEDDFSFDQAGTDNPNDSNLKDRHGAGGMKQNEPNHRKNGVGKPKVRTSSDVWALGCILHQMIFGTTPYSNHRGVVQRIAAIASPQDYIPVEIPAFVSGGNTGISSMLTDVLTRCLRKNHLERPSVEQLLKHPMLNPQQNAQSNIFGSQQQTPSISEQITPQLMADALKLLIHEQAHLYKNKDLSNPNILPKELCGLLLSHTNNMTFPTLLSESIVTTKQKQSHKQQQQQQQQK